MNLDRYLDSEFERVGFVLKDGEVVEVENVCPDPRNGFEVKDTDLMKYPPIAVATWHTHPGKSKVLSREDYHGFRNYPELAHYIVGIDGISKYIVKEGDVLIDATG
jgi:proteasome lid subunit RPN8/RPN11